MTGIKPGAASRFNGRCLPPTPDQSIWLPRGPKAREVRNVSSAVYLPKDPDESSADKISGRVTFREIKNLLNIISDEYGALFI